MYIEKSRAFGRGLRLMKFSQWGWENKSARESIPVLNYRRIKC